MITFRCPSCNNEIETPDDYAGRSARCPTCSRRIRVPRGDRRDGALDLGQQPAATSAVFRVDGRTYQVRPKLDGMLIVASVVIGLSVVAFVASGLTWRHYTPWFPAGLIGAGFALFGALLVLPGYRGIRHGRKTGERLAFVNVAVASLLVLGFLTWAVVSKTMLADTTSCKSRLRAVHAALQAYAAQNGGQFPPQPEVLVSQGYLEASKLTCPHVEGAREGDPTYIRASWRTYTDTKTSVVDLVPGLEPFPGDLLILIDGGVHEIRDETTGRHHRGHYVLTLDGHVNYVGKGAVALGDQLRKQDRIIQRVLGLREINEIEKRKAERADTGASEATDPGDAAAPGPGSPGDR